jgi:hypothetical protein
VNATTTTTQLSSMDVANVYAMLATFVGPIRISECEKMDGRKVVPLHVESNGYLVIAAAINFDFVNSEVTVTTPVSNRAVRTVDGGTMLDHNGNVVATVSTWGTPSITVFYTSSDKSASGVVIPDPTTLPEGVKVSSSDR